MILKKNIDDFEKIIQYTFKNKNNLTLSLVHPSYVKEKNLKKINLANEFERLEFLGDRVLGITIASALKVLSTFSSLQTRQNFISCPNPLK